MYITKVDKIVISPGSYPDRFADKFAEYLYFENKLINCYRMTDMSATSVLCETN